MRIWLLAAMLATLAALWAGRSCELRAWRGDDVALICAGLDPVRVWPLPLLSPYSEDPPQTLIG